MIGLRAWWAARSGFSIAGMVLALLIFVAAIAVWLWLPNDQQLAKKVEQELSTALGVKVSVASVHWQLLPVATIVLATVSTEQTPPVSIKKLTLHPRLAALFKRSFAF
jgi:cell division protein FtsX